MQFAESCDIAPCDWNSDRWPEFTDSLMKRAIGLFVLLQANRVKYNQQNYKEVFTGIESERVKASASKPSLVDAVNVSIINGYFLICFM